MPVITIDYEPHDYQLAVHTHPARFKLVVGGRRVGKSKMALHEIVRHCLEGANRTAWWVAPTHAQAREVGWEEFRLNMDVLMPAIDKVNEALGRIRFKNGSTLLFKSGESERSLRGRGLTFCVIDEAAYIDRDVWRKALIPALSDHNGSAWLVTTPAGRGNWVYELACAAQTPQGAAEGWAYWHWPTMLNPIETPEQIALMRANMSEIEFRQEVLAEWVSKAGYVYQDFSERNLLRLNPGEERISPSPHDYQIILGVDFGFANPTAICFLAVDPVTEEVTQFDELYRPGLMIEEIEGYILATLKKHDLRPEDVDTIYTDPAGNAEELQSGISPVDYLRMSKHRWRVSNKKSLIAPGLALVRSFIRAADGRVRYYITENCVETIRSLRGYSYDSDRREKTRELINEEALKDGIHDHACDALRYALIGRFDHAKWVAYAPEQFKYAGEQPHKRVYMKRCNRCKRQFPSAHPPNVPPHLCRACLEAA
jgi:phage terminase large subunit